MHPCDKTMRRPLVLPRRPRATHKTKFPCRLRRYTALASPTKKTDAQRDLHFHWSDDGRLRLRWAGALCEPCVQFGGYPLDGRGAAHLLREAGNQTREEQNPERGRPVGASLVALTARSATTAQDASPIGQQPYENKISLTRNCLSQKSHWGDATI